VDEAGTKAFFFHLYYLSLAKFRGMVAAHGPSVDKFGPEVIGDCFELLNLVI